MVGQVGNARPVGGDPVTDRGSWMDDVLGNDLEAADADGSSGASCRRRERRGRGYGPGRAAARDSV
jgi:hypothetical protein